MINNYYLGRKALQFNHGLPASHHALLLRGGETWHVSARWGTLIVQELQRVQYNISLNLFQCLQNTTLTTRPVQSGFITTVVLKNNIQQVVCGSGKLFLEEGQFASAYGRAINKHVMLKRNAESMTLDIHYSQELIEQVITEYRPEFKKLFKVHSGYPVIIGEPYRLLNETLKDIINTITQTPYKKALQVRYIDSLIEEYLHNVLDISASEHNLSGPITEGERLKVQKAIDFILNNLYAHHSIAEIANEVKISPTMLKQCFRQVTGKGLFEFLMYQRCLRIRDELVNTNIPLKALYEKSGYKDVPAFINGFKRHMGCSPAALRKGRLS